MKRTHARVQQRDKPGRGSEIKIDEERVLIGSFEEVVGNGVDHARTVPNDESYIKMCEGGGARSGKDSKKHLGQTSSKRTGRKAHGERDQRHS